MIDLGSILLFIGSVFVFLSALGLVRMQTFFMRMQATSKASTLGCILVLVGLCIKMPEWEIIFKSFMLVGFLLLTTPVAVHALARAAKSNDYNK